MNKVKQKLIILLVAAQFFFAGITLFKKSLFSQVQNLSAIHLASDNKAKFKIYDRNKNLIASNIPTASIYAHPSKIIDTQNTLNAIAEILPDLKKQELKNKLDPKKKFSWIKKNITPKEEVKFLYAGLPGVYFKEDIKRVYITKNLFAHTIGYSDTDSVGIAGVEGHCNNNHCTHEINLTLDLSVQHVLRNQIQNAVQKYDARGAAGIIMEANTGEIIAMTSLPDFNPNKIQCSTEDARFNRASLGVYEFGSVMKLFTLAAALDSKSINPDDEFDVSSNIKIDKYIIKDFHPAKKPTYTTKEIMLFSSNIGMARIAVAIGNKLQMEYFKKLQFFDPLKIQIPEKGKTLSPKKNDILKSITLAYGYGMSTTLLHVAQALAALVNNSGCLVDATLIKHKTKTANQECQKVITDETRMTIRNIMRNIVQNGTGRRANAVGYDVGGKTGTGEKIKNGAYNKKLNVSSFLGAFPMSDPKYIIAVIVDEPKSSGSVTGGIVAAPVVKNIVEKIAPMLKIAPQSSK